MVSKSKPDPYLVDDENRPLTDEELANAPFMTADQVFAKHGMDIPKKRGRPFANKTKTQVTLRLDQDIIDHFKGDDPKGWQTRLNAVLRDSMAQK